MKTHRQKAVSDIICSKLNSFSTDLYHFYSKSLQNYDLGRESQKLKASIRRI